MGNQDYGPPPSGDPVWRATQPPTPARDADTPLGVHAAPPMSAAMPTQYAQAYPGSYPTPYAVAPRGSATDKNWLGTASLVLSIVGVWVLGLIFGILGISAAKSGRANNRAMSIWGTSISVAWVLACVTAVVALSSAHVSIFGDRSPYSQLAVGDCIQKPLGWEDAGSDLRASQATKVSCDTRHWGQVYFRDTVSGSSYPGDAAVKARAEQLCSSATAAANIAPEHVDQVVISYIMPSAKSWVADNRSVICFASNKQHTLTSSWVVGPRVVRA